MTSRFITSLVTLLAVAGSSAGESTGVPRLVVSIAVDGLNAEQFERFAPTASADGFKRLLASGHYYPHACFAEYIEDRASGIASLATGATAREGGIIGRYWLDRTTLRPILCVSNPDQAGGPYTPARLSASTLGDELKQATEGRAIVYGIAPWSDAAILSAGHAADGAFWLEGHSQSWSTSSYYGFLPSWARGGGEDTGNNERVAALVEQCLAHSLIGNDDVPDLLALTLEMTEGEQGYRSLDEAVRQILASIDSHIGLTKTLVALTSTGTNNHAVHDEPQRWHIPTGEVYVNRTAALLNMFLAAIYGQGQYVEASFGGDLYLNHRLLEEKQLQLSEVIERSRDFLLETSGVRDVYTAARLREGGTDELRRIDGSFNAKRSGDLRISVAPGWYLINENSHYNRLQRLGVATFPIIFMGGGLEARTINTPVTTQQIAPTLCRAIRIRAPNACSAQPLDGVK